MPILESFKPATALFSGGFAKLLSYAWILLPLFIIFSLFLIFFWIKMIRSKKGQWTHKLKVRRVLQNKLLSEPICHNMRRFPLIKKAEVFCHNFPLLCS